MYLKFAFMSPSSLILGLRMWVLSEPRGQEKNSPHFAFTKRPGIYAVFGGPENRVLFKNRSKLHIT